MKKRLLSVLLCAVILGTMLPMAVSADTEITEVEFSLKTPVLGKTPDAAPTSFSTTPKNAAAVTDSSWYSYADTFEREQLYYYYYCIEPAAGYKFSFDEHGTYLGTIQINGAKVTCAEEDEQGNGKLYVAAVGFFCELFVDGRGYTAEQLKSDLKGTGWSWNAKEEKLTLSGYDGGSILAFRDLSVVLADGTDNTITVPENVDTDAIHTVGSCSLTGKGNLKIKTTDIICSGIRADRGDLSINMSGSLDISAGDDGLYADGRATVSVGGGMTINAEDDGIHAGHDVTISGSGDVSIDAGWFGISSDYMTLSSSGDVSITVAVAGLWVNHILTFSGSGKVTVVSEGEAIFVIDSVLLDGTGYPLSFITVSDQNVAICGGGEQSIGGKNISYYNKITGAPEERSVVYAHESGEGAEPGDVIGDVNGDGKIDAIDATRILLALVGKISLNNTQKKAADVNSDGEINAMDATRILLHCVGKKSIS